MVIIKAPVYMLRGPGISLCRRQSEWARISPVDNLSTAPARRKCSSHCAHSLQRCHRHSSIAASSSENEKCHPRVSVSIDCGRELVLGALEVQPPPRRALSHKARYMNMYDYIADGTHLVVRDFVVSRGYEIDSRKRTGDILFQYLAEPGIRNS